MHHSKRVLLSRYQLVLVTLPLTLLLAWLIFLTPIYLQNMGGSGLKLPQNIISWAIMAIVVTCIWLTLPAGKTIHLTKTARCVLFAIVILAIPLLYTPHQWRYEALIRWFALFGGWIFYISLLQYKAPRFSNTLLYYAILTAVTLQALIALLQFTLPDIIPEIVSYPMLNGKSSGVFQQVNVLASFVATGLALALMLFLLPIYTCNKVWAERLRSRYLGLTLILFPLILVWLQSRIGWIGGLVVALLFLARFHSLNYQRAIWAACLMSLGLVVGLVTLIHGLNSGNGLHYAGHDGSNHARYIMLRDTLAMIGQKPLSGWGYGGFEYSFQHFRLAQGLSTQGVGIARHPHNELLLWWVEGGLAALMGMLLLMACALRLVKTSLKSDHTKIRQFKLYAGDATALCIVLLPFALHTQTEYPFTLSAAHWAIFLLLLAELDRKIITANKCYALNPKTSALLRGAIPTVSITLFVMAIIGLYGNQVLTTTERNGLSDIEFARYAMRFDPWVNTERWHYDQQTHALLMFNQTGESHLLDGYVQWARSYLSYRIDKNVYANWMAIAQYQQDPITYRRLLQEAHSLFPDDKRFVSHDVPPLQRTAL
ncbi:lipid A core-O-antigen ligase [Buttiauxella ferragutiae ATCC 51602]|uniref:Lipid A core-O-antigen ligase n=1 Tax=Buttiauxella ferragutiae ATCC 51602 TaxID=1354252 RepID=A0ABX2WEK8_9ENTR|nr:O-antigen ligase family protein [Buttiauxella ferragutiae]OAT33515.1 lipid A core-O-antigen ligase [Buttiauxella ferragutiae ATCC 51602]